MLWTGPNCHPFDLSHSCRSGQLCIKSHPKIPSCIDPVLLASQKTVLAWALHSSPGLNEESHSALRDVDGYIPARRAEERKKEKWYWHIERRARSGALIETAGDEESSLDLLFILRTYASGFPDLLYLASKLHGITYRKTVMYISTTLKTSNLTN